jgi:hypothetical protein
VKDTLQIIQLSRREIENLDSGNLSQRRKLDSEFSKFKDVDILAPLENSTNVICNNLK